MADISIAMKTLSALLILSLSLSAFGDTVGADPKSIWTTFHLETVKLEEDFKEVRKFKRVQCSGAPTDPAFIDCSKCSQAVTQNHQPLYDTIVRLGGVSSEGMTRIANAQFRVYNGGLQAQGGQQNATKAQIGSLKALVETNQNEIRLITERLQPLFNQCEEKTKAVVDGCEAHGQRNPNLAALKDAKELQELCSQRSNEFREYCLTKASANNGYKADITKLEAQLANLESAGPRPEEAPARAVDPEPTAPRPADDAVAAAADDNTEVAGSDLPRGDSSRREPVPAPAPAPDPAPRRSSGGMGALPAALLGAGVGAGAVYFLTKDKDKKSSTTTTSTASSHYLDFLKTTTTTSSTTSTTTTATTSSTDTSTDTSSATTTTSSSTTSSTTTTTTGTDSSTSTSTDTRM